MVKIPPICGNSTSYESIINQISRDSWEINRANVRAQAENHQLVAVMDRRAAVLAFRLPTVQSQGVTTEHPGVGPPRPFCPGLPGGRLHCKRDLGERGANSANSLAAYKGPVPTGWCCARMLIQRRIDVGAASATLPRRRPDVGYGVFGTDWIRVAPKSQFGAS